MPSFSRGCGVLVVSLCSVLWSGMCSADGPPPCPGPSRISMGSGSFSTRPEVTFHLKHFRAMLVPMGKTSPVCFQHYTDVSQAEIFVTNESLTALFGQKLAATDTKITDLKIQNRADGVTITGKMKKLIPIVFSISGPLTTNGSELRMDAKSIKADGIPVKALLGMVGEHLNAVLQLKNAKGITVQEDSLSFSPEQVAHLRGHIASVATSPEGLTLRYSPEHGQRGTAPSAP